MKKILILLAFTIFQLNANEESVQFLGDCDLGLPINDYLKIELLNGDTTQPYFKSSLYVGCDTNFSMFHLEKQADKLYTLDTSYSFNDVTIEQIFNKLELTTSEYSVVSELKLNSDTLSKGLLYFDSEIISSDTIDIKDPNDSTQVFEYGAVKTKTVGYIISWDGEADYALEYDSSEIDEVLLFNNGNYLYRLEDNDRNNKIVGIKYYSSKDDNIYIRYFEPNN
jgi:hypothetical protein